MSQFKKMLAEAANTFEKDEEVENIIVVVAKRNEEMIEQHTLTNIAYPLGSMRVMLEQALMQIAKAKMARLDSAPTQES